MIEATCTACGTVNRIADADVPVGAKFVNCASCKSRVAIPVKTQQGPGTAGPTSALDLADLPAPRRQSALGGESAKPAPRSGLAAAATPEPELPAPRTRKPSPSAAPSALDLDDLLAPPDGGADLPAPRPASQKSVSDLPAPRAKDPALRPGGGRAMTDLPVPGVADTAPLADLPSPKPKSQQDLSDLPAPRPKIPVPSIPKAPPAIPTPPAHAKPSAGIIDLPGPKPKVPNIPVMPPPAKAAPAAGVIDLPTPKPTGLGDLPAPKPGQAADLPAPKGFFEDLPQPAAASRQQPQKGAELPAPKGFFEDLPQPAAASRQQQPDDVAPKGFFEDLPGRPNTPATPGGIAPKGFFEDLPGRPNKPSAPGGIAPKGFFEDLPGRPAQAKPEVPAPKGFFEDLPGRPNEQKADGMAPKGFFDDLPKPAPAQGVDELDSLDLEPNEPSNAGIELDMGDTALELSDDVPKPRAKPASAAPSPGPSNQFDDLDLSTPSPVSFAKKGTVPAPGAPPPAVATISAQAAAAASASARPMPPAYAPKSGDVSLELEEPRKGGGVVSSGATSKLSPKERADQKKAKAAVSKERSARTRKIALAVLLAALALGGGGFYMYQRHAKAEAHEAAVEETLVTARKHLAAAKWSLAMVSASKTLELEKTHGEALGIRAEALFALGISEGGNQPRFAQARKMLAEADKAAKSHPALDRARALSPIAANQAAQAVKNIKALAARAPQDPTLQLYLGWALAAQGDHENAIKAFEAARTAKPLELHALYGRGRSKQALGDLEAARADFASVIELQKDHVGAQVGLAVSLPASQSQQQEADLLAILALKDIEKKEPRNATTAWIMAADIARRGGRFDLARERYRKALALSAADIGALTGLAETELRDGKLDVAAELIGKVLAPAPDNVRANLVAAEISIGQKQLEPAATRLDALAKRTPPLARLDQARMKLLQAQLYEAQGKEQDSIDAYLEASKLAGDIDLAPTLVAVAKLTQLAAKYEGENDTARASELRKKADALLGALADAAEKDPQLALTLGMAYLQANDPIKAETWLRKVIETKPKDVDAQYQLAKALTKQGKDEEAIQRLRQAVELDPTRSEIGLELARTYEDSKRFTDAEKLYDKLLAAQEPPLELRARAGRFFARIGEMAKAGEQGVAILALQEDHPAGLYLKGEGLLKDGKTDAARKLLVQASDADPEPQYFDARGRAAEKWAEESGNTTYQDDALRSYGKAVEKDPTFFSSWVGMGRLYVLRKEDAKATDPLAKAWALKQTAEVARLQGIAVKNLNAQPDVAAKWLKEALDREPSAEAAYHLGLLYIDARLNNPRAAVSSLQTATDLALKEEKSSGKPAPAWLTDALYTLGDLHRTQGNLKSAKAIWQTWLNRKPTGATNTARITEVTYKMQTELKDI